MLLAFIARHTGSKADVQMYFKRFGCFCHDGTVLLFSRRTWQGRVCLTPGNPTGHVLVACCERPVNEPESDPHRIATVDPVERPDASKPQIPVMYRPELRIIQGIPTMRYYMKGGDQ